MSLETLLARLEAESVTSVTSRKSADVTDLLITNQLSNAGNVGNVEKSVKPRQERKNEAANDPAQPSTSTRVEIPAELVRLIQAMGEYWHYSIDDYETAFEGMRSDPDQWRTLCIEDAKRFGWELPSVRSPGELDEAVAEAVAERRAILEHEAKLNAEQADAVTKLAANFYRHVFGVACETGCCKPRSGFYCAEGLRLRDAYYEVAS